MGLHEYEFPASAGVPICVLSPMQIGLSSPALAFGGGSIVTVTNAESMHVPLETSTLYFVVIVGFAVGVAIFESSNPVLGDHSYFAPPLANSFELAPSQILVSLETVALIVPMVTRTVSRAVQPPFPVTVRMYCVVLVGDAVGFALVASSKPFVGCQLYVNPVCAASPISVLAPMQRVLSCPALAVGCGLTVMVTKAESSHVPLETSTL